MPIPLKLVDSSYATTIPQPQSLKYAKILSKADYHQQAYDELKAMLEGKKEADFERAVFLSENTYYGGRFSYSAFQNSIRAKQMFIEKLIEANDQSDTIDFNVHVNENGRFKLADIRYLPHQKKELYRKALSNWAIFKYITDTVFIHTLKDSAFYTLYHAPYAYATADPFGMKNWRNSQVINLLVADGNQGNCFALTALYKILSDRLQADAKLCTAPQHIYIQHQDPKGQYYNVELATAGHPGDGIIQTLTYTPSEAIMSGIALRDYNTKQRIGLCLVNLAKSYEHTFNTKDDEFLLRCAELALAHDSLNLNALLLKQQVLDIRVTKYATQHHLNSITKLKQDKGIMPLVNKLEKHLFLLYQLGYREMPLEMQEQIMNPFGYDTKKWNHVSQNARPFTSFEPKDPKDAEYWTLTKGMFKEVWEPTTKETYGHYTITTATGKLKSIDTTSHKGQLIDPVAFAYDFGARIYDARIGHFVSVDPLQAKYPDLSPYNFAGNNPILFKDNDGREIIIHYKDEKGENKAFTYQPGIKPPSNAFVEQTLAALEYLHNGSKTAAKIINKAVGLIDKANIIESKITQYSAVQYGADDNPLLNSDGSAANLDFNQLEFNPIMGLETVSNSEINKQEGDRNGTDEIQSPAIGLIHELKHFVNDAENPNSMAKRTARLDRKFHNKEEKNVIKSETKIVKELKEPSRTNHSGKTRIVENSTSRKLAPSDAQHQKGKPRGRGI